MLATGDERQADIRKRKQRPGVVLIVDPTSEAARIPRDRFLHVVDFNGDMIHRIERIFTNLGDFHLAGVGIIIAVIHKILLVLNTLQTLGLAIELIEVQSLDLRTHFDVANAIAELLVGPPLIEFRTD
jgi:hypothetical protein